MRGSLIFLILIGLSTPGWATTGQDPVMAKFLRQTVLSALRESQPPAQAVRRVLVQDEQGRPLSFIPDCPICEAVQQAFQDYLPEAPETGASAFDQEEPLARTRALSGFVQESLAHRLAELDEAEREDLKRRLRRGAEIGTAALKRAQRDGAPAYQMMWSCQMCDAATHASQQEE